MLIATGQFQSHRKLQHALGRVIAYAEDRVRVQAFLGDAVDSCVQRDRMRMHDRLILLENESLAAGLGQSRPRDAKALHKGRVLADKALRQSNTPALKPDIKQAESPQHSQMR